MHAHKEERQTEIERERGRQRKRERGKMNCIHCAIVLCRSRRKSAGEHYTSRIPLATFKRAFTMNINSLSPSLKLNQTSSDKNRNKKKKEKEKGEFVRSKRIATERHGYSIDVTSFSL